MIEEHTETHHNYLISQKELKEKLGIVGDIKEIGLWEGLSPDDKMNNISNDTCTFAISTIEEDDANCTEQDAKEVDTESKEKHFMVEDDIIARRDIEDGNC